MFIALYRWKLKPGKEDQFRKAWSEVTVAIRENCGSSAMKCGSAYGLNFRQSVSICSMTTAYFVFGR